MKTGCQILIGVMLTAAMLACDSMELTIGVVEDGSGTLIVSNANDSEWSDARLVVEAVETDNSRSLCAEKSIGTWKPDETISVRACGSKIRLTLTVGGETARFSYANRQLYRVFGRKEVPVAP